MAKPKPKPKPSHEAEVQRFWDLLRPFHTELVEYANAHNPSNSTDITFKDIKIRFDQKVEDYGELDLRLMATRRAPAGLRAEADADDYVVDRYNLRGLALILEKGLQDAEPDPVSAEEPLPAEEAEPDEEPDYMSELDDSSPDSKEDIQEDFDNITTAHPDNDEEEELLTEDLSGNGSLSVDGSSEEKPFSGVTAFGLKDRIYRAGCQKVPKFRFKPGKNDDDEDQYLLDLFFKIVVSPPDVKDSDHASHIFRQDKVVESIQNLSRVGPDGSTIAIGVNSEEMTELDAEKLENLLVPATGDKVVVNYQAQEFTLDIRDLLTDERIRLDAIEGIFLREIYPDARKGNRAPTGELIIEARGCPYHLGGRDWPRRLYHIAIVHKSEKGGLFEGMLNDAREKLTPGRIMKITHAEEDESDGPPAEGEESDQNLFTSVDDTEGEEDVS